MDLNSLQTVKKARILLSLSLVLSILIVSGKSKYDLIILDVDSKDPKVGMSSPPEAFVEPKVLNGIRSKVNDEGD